MKKYSVEEFRDKRDYLEKAYFGKVKEGFDIRYPAEEKIEEKIVEDFLKKGEIGLEVVAWKAGTEMELVDNKIVVEKNDGIIKTGRGKIIEIYKVEEYMNFIKAKWENYKGLKVTEKNFKTIYNAFRKPLKSEIKVGNFGSVYIINLLYFLSSEKWPIYDKFAHAAAKALVLDKHPKEVFVGGALDKNSVRDVTNMYWEYIEYIKGLGLYNGKIDRADDRALWAYGHAKQ